MWYLSQWRSDSLGLRLRKVAGTSCLRGAAGSPEDVVVEFLTGTRARWALRLGQFNDMAGNGWNILCSLGPSSLFDE